MTAALRATAALLAVVCTAQAQAQDPAIAAVSAHAVATFETACVHAVGAARLPALRAMRFRQLPPAEALLYARGRPNVDVWLLPDPARPLAVMLDPEDRSCDVMSPVVDLPTAVRAFEDLIERLPQTRFLIARKIADNPATGEGHPGRTLAYSLHIVGLGQIGTLGIAARMPPIPPGSIAVILRNIPLPPAPEPVR